MQREDWHLTEGLIFAHFAVFILSSTMQGGLQALASRPAPPASVSVEDRLSFR